jgi:hypothetical protein
MRQETLGLERTNGTMAHPSNMKCMVRVLDLICVLMHKQMHSQACVPCMPRPLPKLCSVPRCLQAAVNEAHLPGVRVGPKLTMHLQVRSDT